MNLWDLVLGLKRSEDYNAIFDFGEGTNRQINLLRFAVMLDFMSVINTSFRFSIAKTIFQSIQVQDLLDRMNEASLTGYITLK